MTDPTGNTSISKSTRSRGLRASVFQTTRYQDHFSLQAPTSVVRFSDHAPRESTTRTRPTTTVARVIYNQDSQLILEEEYKFVGPRGQKKKIITIKQIAEDVGGGLRFLRFTYSLVAALFMGFLIACAVQVLVLVIFDLAIHTGITGVQQQATWGVAIGALLSIPLLVHGFAAVMMLAGFFVVDLWQGHTFFHKFVVPALATFLPISQGALNILVEWIFLFGLLLLPLLVMATLLAQKNENWWEYASLYWFYSVLAFYLLFITSVLWYEARTYWQMIQDSDLFVESSDANPNLWRRIIACVAVRKRNTLSGYARTTYSSFGSPGHVFMTEQRKLDAIPGTLYENQRNVYTRFTQSACLHNVLYTTLPTPKRMYSIDDVIGRRPYVTSLSWGLEKYFCKPRKTRYVGILNGPSALTTAQLKSAILCSVLGIAMIYILIGAVMAYLNFNVGALAAVLVLILLLSLPFWWHPCKTYGELKRLGIVQKSGFETTSLEWMANAAAGMANAAAAVTPTKKPQEEDGDSGGEKQSIQEENDEVVTEKENADVEADQKKVTFEGVGGGGGAQDDDPASPAWTKKEDSIEFVGFSSPDDESISRGIYNVSEKYRITQPTKSLRVVMFLLETVLLIVWPTFSLYFVENLQLATVYLFVGLLTYIRHYTNAEVLLEEMAEVVLFAKNNKNENEEDEALWENQSRLSQVAGTIGRGKAFQGWRFVFWVLTVGMLFLFAQSQSQKLMLKDFNANLVDDFYYDGRNSLDYAACNLTKNIEGNQAMQLADYTVFAIMAYETDDATRRDLDKWYGPGVIQIRTDVVDNFRRDESPAIPVFYKLFTDQENRALVSIRGSQDAW